MQAGVAVGPFRANPGEEGPMTHSSIPLSGKTGRRRLPFSETLARWPFLQIAPLLTFLIVVFVLPVASILVLSVYDSQGALTFANFQRLFTGGLYVSVLLKTLQTAAWATLICLVLGYPVAFALTKTRASLRAALLFAVLVPLWTS